MVREGFAAKADIAEPWKQLELSAIKAIELRAASMPDVVSLAQGIPSFDTPAVIKQYVKQKLDEGACAKYSLSPGLPALRELISEHLRQEGMAYDPDGEILVTCGSIEAIAATLLALVPPGSEVLLPSPSYTSYLSAIHLAGATPRFVPLEEDSGFDLDPDVLSKAMSRRTKAILLAQPNNPTGTIFPRATIAALLRAAERVGAVVIADEVYKDFVYTAEPVTSPAHFAAHRQHVVRVCSFSKAYAMTGWRVGFLQAERNLAARILRVHDALVTCAPVVSQYAAMAALEHSEEIVAPFREEFRRRRERMIQHLDSMPDVFDYQKPEASYFVFPRLKDTVPSARDSRMLALRLLEEARVAVVPGVAFGPTGEGHLRFCFARPAEDIDVAFDRLRTFFRGSKPAPVPSLPRPTPQPNETMRPGVRRRRQLARVVLSTLARASLRRHRPLIVGIAGGRGKTVTKRLLTELLSEHFDTRANPLSYNTEIGLPLAILGVVLDTSSTLALGRALLLAAYRAVRPPRTAVLVLEYGVRQPGDAARLVRVASPDILVLTPTAGAGAYDEHSAQTLRDELAYLVAAAASKGAPVVACEDDPFCRALGLPDSTHFLRASLPSESDPRTVLTVGGHEIPLTREFVGTSEYFAIQAALVVGSVLGVPVEGLRKWGGLRD